jgi:hypothetical protein
MDILCRLDGTYEVYVRIQDGTESCGTYATEREAQAAWRRAMKTLNNARLSSSRTTTVFYETVVERVEWATREDLLGAARSSTPKIVRVPPAMAHLLSPECIDSGGTSRDSASGNTKTTSSTPGEEGYRRIQTPPETSP